MQSEAKRGNPAYARQIHFIMLTTTDGVKLLDTNAKGGKERQSSGLEALNSPFAFFHISEVLRRYVPNLICLMNVFLSVSLSSFVVDVIMIITYHYPLPL